MGHIALDVDGARVAFTDRHGGVSIPPYDTANLGFADPNQHILTVAGFQPGNAETAPTIAILRL